MPFSNNASASRSSVPGPKKSRPSGPGGAYTAGGPSTGTNFINTAPGGNPSAGPVPPRGKPHTSKPAASSEKYTTGRIGPSTSSASRLSPMSGSAHIGPKARELGS